MNIKTTKERELAFINKLNNQNKDIEYIKGYTKAINKATFKCLKCGHIWDAIPNNILRGKGCPKCALNNRKKKRTKTHEQFTKEINQIHPNLEILDIYKNNYTKIHIKCNICNHSWETTPKQLLHLKNCPSCSRHIPYTKETFQQKLNDLESNLVIISEYINANTYITVQCKKCGYQYKVLPSNLLSGSKCPKCKQSKGEYKISQYLQNKDIKFIKEYCIHSSFSNRKYIKVDFYLPDYNIFIEYNGIQHYQPVAFDGNIDKANIRYEEQVIRDKELREYSIENNYKLIEISYKQDVEEILNEQLVKDYLMID